MANGIYVWDGSGWLPSSEAMVGILIPPRTAPVPITATTSRLISVAPNPVTKGGTVTLTAQVTPSAAGTYAFQWYTGKAWSTFSSKAISGGKASTTNVPSATVSYRAVFTPSAPTSFKPSTSAAVSLKVNAALVKPTTPITIGSTGNSQGVYKGTGGKRSDVSGSSCYYGYYSSFNGDQRSLVVLTNVAAIRAVAKADVKSATITFTNNHTYANSGGSVRIVPLANTSIPSTFVTKPGGGFAVTVPRSGSVTVGIPLAIAQQFCAGGTASALALIANVSGSSSYGYLTGDSIRITFNRK